MSATDNLGPHLLGRFPSVPDPRDYQLETFLSADPLDVALAALLKSRAARATKDWATFITPYLKAVTPVAPTPDPTPTPSGTVWDDTEAVLDQGQTGHCVGFGSAQWGNTLPVDDHFANADGDAIYYEAKVIDGEPKAEDGSQVRSGVKALQNRGRLKTYAFTTSLDTIKKFVVSNGPIIVGTDWYNDMFSPDANGYVVPTGTVAGGHCYLLIGYLPDEDAFEFLNSWGASWGLKGRFKMKTADFAKLLAANGEACAAVEVV